MGLVEGERTLPEPQITLHGIHLSRIESLPRFQPMPRSAPRPAPPAAR
jgi:hypothetical protein